MIQPHYNSNNKFYLSTVDSKGDSNLDLSYKFSDTHIELQHRIDRILGSGFEGHMIHGKGDTSQLQYDASWGDGNFKAINTTDLEYILNNLASHYNNGYWKGYHDTGFGFPYFMSDGRTIWLKVNDRGGIFKGNINEQIKVDKGWKDVTWLHEHNAKDLMAKLFSVAKGDNGDFLPKLSTNESISAYHFPSSDCVSKYKGNDNFKYFIRCAPENIGCQLFHIDISISSALMLIGGLVVGVLSGGALLTLAVPTLLSLANNLPSFKKLNITSEADIQNKISDLVSIKNGADVIMTNTSQNNKDELLNLANNYLQANPNLFIPNN